MLELGPIGFAAPAMLLALLLLPLLWWLLRITPPMPRLIRFPPVRLLFGLQSKEETPASAPLWLILLRLAMAALLMIGLAHPLLNPGSGLAGDGPLLLVVDDGWAAARDWPARQTAMLAAVDRAAREDRAVVILSTAPGEAGQKPAPSGVLRPAEARGLVSALQPRPWPVDRRAAADSLDALAASAGRPILWLSDGLQDDGADELVERLRRMGNLRVLSGPPAFLPRLLLPPEAGTVEFKVTVRRAATGLEQTVRLRAVAADGRLLAGEDAVFAAGKDTAQAVFALPVELRNRIARLEIENESTAGAVALLDERWRRRPVGLVAASPLDAALSLLDELYYIERALDPFGEVRRSPLETLVEQQNAAIILPDGHPLTPGEAALLERWIDEGGLLLRFAGPRLAEAGADTLAPVTLRKGGRTLGGAMLWTEPARLAEFAEDSPYHGIAIPEDVLVSRQVLAEPSLDLADKTWARLRDGTPLVTAERRGKGWLVLVHTSANPEWSNLALSGLFVEMLRRTVAMSQGVDGDSAGSRPLPPLELLDGFGRLGAPPAAAIAIQSAAFAEARPAPSTPPGFYGNDTARRALNLGPTIGPLAPLALPAGLVAGDYQRTGEIDLKPWLLMAALLLLLADSLATLAMRGLMTRPVRQRAAAGLAALLLGAALLTGPGPARAQQAQDPEQKALEATLATRLAYIRTGSDAVDRVSEAGLAGLTLVLNRRTAVEAAAPVGVDPAIDELAFFPLIYWPITQEQPALTGDAVVRINRYLANGGTILFDTRDGNFGNAAASAGTQRLRTLAEGLDIPRLLPVPADHVLTKAFYLMQDFPGRWAGGRLWVEQPGERVNDGVSRVIVGGNDWAAAWAVDNAGIPMFPVVPAGEAQREMAFRFGVNLVMYALTGNYKSDQVHVPAILERLGQ
jgi:hypothetical protein